MAPDYLTLCLYLALAGIGWVMIYTVGMPLDGYPDDPAAFMATPIGKQTIFIVISLLVMAFLIYIVDQQVWQTGAYFFYILSILLLVLVLFFGNEIKGAKSWFDLGGFAFQPSEIAKLGTALAIAAYTSHWSTRLDQFRSGAMALGLLVLPMGLILLQPDAGSGLVFLSFLIALYREGMPVWIYLVGFFSAVVFVLGILFSPLEVLVVLGCFVLLVFAFNTRRQQVVRWVGGSLLVAAAAYWLLQTYPTYLLYILAGVMTLVLLFSVLQYQRKRGRLAGLMTVMLIYGFMLANGANYAFNNILQPHQQTRIDVWLRPGQVNNRAAGYNLVQSKTAISAGGLTGKGLFEGTMTKLNYVPEQQTDFIFCAVGEEQGFVGVLSVVGLYLFLMLRVLVLAERQDSRFNRVYAYGIAGILFVHFTVNIGMTLGLMPIIGIPLPFLSKGGSSLLGFSIMLAILLRMDMQRARAKPLRIL